MNYIEKTTLEYPLDRFTLIERYPNVDTSSIEWSNEILDLLNVSPVYMRSSPHNTDWKKKYVEIEPILENGKWFQNWELVDKTQAELDDYLTAQWDSIQRQKNYRISLPVTILPNGNVQFTSYVEKPPSYQTKIIYVPNEKQRLTVIDANIHIAGQSIAYDAVYINNEPIISNKTIAITTSNVVIQEDNLFFINGEIILNTINDGSMPSDVEKPIDLIYGIENTGYPITNPGEIITIKPQPNLEAVSTVEITKNEYDSYIEQLEKVTDQPDPFNIIWPENPFSPGSKPLASLNTV